MFKDVKELKDLLNELEYTDTVVLENCVIHMRK